MSEVKPCPFCGNIVTPEIAKELLGWGIECKSCGVQFRAFDDKASAIEAWNTRIQNTKEKS